MTHFIIYRKTRLWVSRKEWCLCVRKTKDILASIYSTKETKVPSNCSSSVTNEMGCLHYMFFSVLGHCDTTYVMFRRCLWLCSYCTDWEEAIWQLCKELSWPLLLKAASIKVHIFSLNCFTAHFIRYKHLYLRSYDAVSSLALSLLTLVFCNWLMHLKPCCNFLYMFLS